MGEYSAGTLDRVFSAVADPTRRAILARLADSEARVAAASFPHAWLTGAVSMVARGMVKGKEVSFSPATALKIEGWISRAPDGTGR